jgi:hypothetical protein
VYCQYVPLLVSHIPRRVRRLFKALAYYLLGREIRIQIKDPNIKTEP